MLCAVGCDWGSLARLERVADLSPGGSKLLGQMGGQDARRRHCECGVWLAL